MALDVKFAPRVTAIPPPAYYYKSASSSHLGIYYLRKFQSSYPPGLPPAASFVSKSPPPTLKYQTPEIPLTPCKSDSHSSSGFDYKLYQYMGTPTARKSSPARPTLSYTVSSSVRRHSAAYPNNPKKSSQKSTPAIRSAQIPAPRQKSPLRQSTLPSSILVDRIVNKSIPPQSRIPG